MMTIMCIEFKINGEEKLESTGKWIMFFHRMSADKDEVIRRYSNKNRYRNVQMKATPIVYAATVKPDFSSSVQDRMFEAYCTWNWSIHIQLDEILKAKKIFTAALRRDTQVVQQKCREDR